MLKLHPVIEVLRLICADPGIASVVQTIDKYPTYGHLLRIKEKHIRKTFFSLGPLLLKPLVYQEVSEHISDHVKICE